MLVAPVFGNVVAAGCDEGVLSSVAAAAGAGVADPAVSALGVVCVATMSELGADEVVSWVVAGGLSVDDAAGAATCWV